MITMTKKELIANISQKQGVELYEVRDILQAFLEEMAESLGEKKRIEFRDFGVFELVERKQKIGRNPKQADVAIVIPARYAVKFTPGKKLKQRIEKLPVVKKKSAH
ncbi:HU family DNA-binding protein [Rhabdochlamydiaceae symbiont of Dictyostelium giganteum]|uniref:HU family DNA-binding protein n=1 Tax=Rhabdochlamydiaceae symbiont of Dictyostelium giganteum TaxID=3342349 RepID=UPI00384C306C